MASTPDNPEATCPLCGKSNRCAIAAGTPARDCWCRKLEISAAALAAVPAQAKGRYCLCPDCARNTGESDIER